MWVLAQRSRRACVAVALGLVGLGCSWDFVGERTASATVTHWSVTDEATGAVLSEGCARSEGRSSKVRFVAAPGQRVAAKFTAEDVIKSQEEPIPHDNDTFWCSRQSDSSRSVTRGTSQESCAVTASDAPATLDSVELIRPESSGIKTTAEGYVLHLTVVRAGVLKLLFNVPPCWSSGQRSELTILDP